MAPMTPHRRSSHGAECPLCGSCNVVIRNTRTRVLPCEGGKMVMVKKQECQCRRCDYVWWRRIRETREMLPWQ